MSGPKAFRIVTRAEIMTICRRSLARLDAAIEDWISRGERNGTIDKTDIDKVIARRDVLRGLLSADKFVELQKQIPAEISYLQADAERRAERAAEMEAQSKQTMRRMRGTAQALLASAGSSGIQLPSEIREELTSAKTPSERLEAAINKAFLLLHAAPATEGVSELQRSVAARLGAGEKRMSLEEWTSQQPGVVEDRALLQVDGFLGELKGLGIDPSPFSTRITALELESPARRPLLADSLLLDLATAVKKGREHARLQSDLRARHAELSEMKSPEAASLRSEIGDILSRATQRNEAELIKRADFLIEEEVQAIAAEERRRAVLEGLAGLGYEVSEGMATAWVNGGRVVLRKAANPGYGVELSGGSKSDLLQVRAVAFGNSTEMRDISRDRDIETIWCGEFERLQSLIANDGGHLAIEHARPVGQFPLKVVEDKNGTAGDNDAVTVTRHLLR
ncbi:hypothetical protein JQ629_36075 [Bradyrhizobium sp. AUGA SZCCT0222]|uniref:hypothetical protein n=1 Tax=Bradyrhizobium sp. AUGA SZCCT0222 TaxID=2807668 RepID=UPI001BA693A9|nr:hypothetical protein [Bradyrhizobium sp. AUGA SZCCT0222]MBR1272901.1 hypothetical protein [Bradyrhizobium sp. AUGA SZCCT0222]